MHNDVFRFVSIASAVFMLRLWHFARLSVYDRERRMTAIIVVDRYWHCHVLCRDYGLTITAVLSNVRLLMKELS